jgi:hypothetical protein
MNLTDSIAATSDQLDAVDLLSGPRTFTIQKVSTHNAEQPFNFHLAEFPRVWRPGKSMRRVIVAAWGADPDAYTGKRVTLYCDPSVQFGGIAVGGTRISHMSGIEGPLKVPLLVKRGQTVVFTVQPLQDASTPTTDIPDTSGRNWMTELELAGNDLDAIASLGASAAHFHAPAIDIEAIRNRYRELKAATE